MKDTPASISKQQFILDWLKEHQSADIYNHDFHEAWFELFGGKQIIFPFGSNPCPNAQVWLKRLFDRGLISRHRQGFQGMKTGFGKWAYVYSEIAS